MTTLTFGSLFAGVGGFDLGLERAGMQCRWQVEIDPFCQKVLAKHWPHVARYEDVRECGKHNLEPVDLVCGGFPCQPHSEAGKQKGADDDRDLWPEYRRLIAELRPRWVVAENVPGIRHTILDAVLSDLEGLDYSAGTLDLPAVAFDARHIRHRIFIIAHTNRPEQGGREQSQWRPDQRNAEPPRNGPQGGTGFVAHTCNVDGQCASPISEQRQRYSGMASYPGRWPPEPSVGRVAYGIPNRLDRLRSLGNAVVPQVAEWIGRRIVEADAL